MKFGHLFRIVFSVVLVVLSMGHAFLVERVGEGAAREIGSLYCPQALKNAGLAGKGPERSGQLALKGSTEIFTVGSSTGIGYLAHKGLHALSGGIQGAVLDLKNPGQGALWGAIGAAGGEVAMEAVYDPKARSEAISEGMKARMARGELAQMLAEAGVELPQLDQGGEQTLGDGSQPLAHAGSRQGVLTRSQARTQQGRGGTQPQADKGNLDGAVMRDPWGEGVRDFAASSRLQGSQHSSLIAKQRQNQGQSRLDGISPAQVEAGLEQVFIKNLRADVERSRNLVRLGMSGVALAGGVDGAQISMMDDMAYQALTHNAIPLVGYVGGAALEAAMPGLLAAAAGALGVTYAWDAMTGLFSASTDQIVELPFNTTDHKLPVKGKVSQGAPAVGQSTAGGMMPEDPNDHNEEEPRERKSQGKNNAPKKDKKLKVRNGVEKVELKPEEEVGLRKEFNKFDKLQESTKEEIKFYWKKYSEFEGEQLGAKTGKPADATTLNAARIERGGRQIELAKQRGLTYNHGEKVKNAQKGLKNIIRLMNKDLKPKPIIKHLNKGRPLPQADQEALKQMVTKAARLLKRTKEYLPFPDK